MESLTTIQPAGSQFPHFSDGDTVIILPGARHYRLHSNVLRENSDTLAKFLRESHAADLCAKARKNDTKTRFRIDLINVTNHSSGFFVQRRLNNMGACEFIAPMGGLENGTVPLTILKHYDNIFRAVYNQPFEMDTESLGTVLRDCMELLQLGEDLGASNAVTHQIDVALLGHGRVLFKAISAGPADWAKVGIRARSPAIVKECVIHLVGIWGSLTEWQKADLNLNLRELCERKHADFTTKKKMVDMRLIGHYSPTTFKRKEDDPGRVNYANDVYSWLALSVYRHWLAQNIAEGKTWRAEDGGSRFYKLVHKGDDAYLDRDTLEAFHAYFPMTCRAMGVLRNHLKLYKDEMKAFVEPLMINKTQVELKEGEYFPHLVAIDVHDYDVAWVTGAVPSDRASTSSSAPTLSGEFSLYGLPQQRRSSNWSATSNSGGSAKTGSKRMYDAIRDCDEQGDTRKKSTNVVHHVGYSSNSE